MSCIIGIASLVAIVGILVVLGVNYVEYKTMLDDDIDLLFRD